MNGLCHQSIYFLWLHTGNPTPSSPLNHENEVFLHSDGRASHSGFGDADKSAGGQKHCHSGVRWAGGLGRCRSVWLGF